MSAVTEALTAYRAAVDEMRRAEHKKQKAAQALYEARQAAGDTTSGASDSGKPRSIGTVWPTATSTKATCAHCPWTFETTVPGKDAHELMEHNTEEHQ